VPLSEQINGAVLRAYEYDSTRKLIRMVEYTGSIQLNKVLKRYTFEYNKESLLTRIRETNLAARDRSYIYELDYDGSNVISIRPFRVYNSGPRAEDTLTVVYDDKNRVSQLLSIHSNDSKWEYDSVGNVKKWLIRTPDSSTDSLVAEYTSYDDKVNLNAFSKAIQIVNLLDGRPISKRNPLKYTFKGRNIDASYLYNEKRVPTEVILRYRSLSDTVLRETVYMYDLNCK